jgi:hypothetical protein
MASFTTLLIALVLSPAVASDAQLPKIRNSAENAGHANSGPGSTNNHTVPQGGSPVSDPAGSLLDVNSFLDVNSTLAMPLLDALSGNMTSSQLVGVLAVFASAALPMDQTSEERAGDAGSAPAGLRGAVDQAKAAEARTGNFTTVAGFFPHYHPHRGTRNICSGVAGAGFYCTRGGTTLVRCCGSAVGATMCGALQGCCGYHVGGGAYLNERCMSR